ncbi:unnamed protein product [Calicophoron daubneyi]|uniref:Uncharacterized protein n=1 Tax=Calicophoron daubneyi TaxID=300641 RepID=A0AAV2TGC8_CALDB
MDPKFQKELLETELLLLEVQGRGLFRLRELIAAAIEAGDGVVRDVSGSAQQFVHLGVAKHPYWPCLKNLRK